MSDKLTVWTAAKEVSTAVGTMVNTYKTLRTVKKQESIILKEKIRAFQTIARARGMGEVARANIDEIAKTQNFIDNAWKEPITSTSKGKHWNERIG